MLAKQCHINCHAKFLFLSLYHYHGIPITFLTCAIVINSMVLFVAGWDAMQVPCYMNTAIT